MRGWLAPAGCPWFGAGHGRTEAGTARRRVGRGQPALSDLGPRGGTAPDEAAALLDRAGPERPLPGIPTSAGRVLGWAPPAPSRALFEAVTRRLDRRGLVVRSGTVVDATPVPSAGIRHEGEARWAGNRRREALHRHEAPIATDQEVGPMRMPR